MVTPIYLIKPSTFTLDKYYKVYATETSYIFIKLGGQFYEENAVEKQYLLLGLIFSFFRKKILANKRSVLENKVDKGIELNPDSLLAKRNNFKVDLDNIKTVEVSEKSTFHTAWNDNGSVKITLRNGKVLKFIIPLSVSAKLVIDSFESKKVLNKTVN
ncbi:hypothetical protein SB775_18080 [Peribacillus sp. SIMBA_075]|uniref:hypothetical protein n=1 Tax=Peribacillus sp. SIMBA_075 TaxID=3085813 RepID=UPI003979EC2E